MHIDNNFEPEKEITYDQVCVGKTGYIEVTQILFDSDVTQYEDLVKFLYTLHDPTDIHDEWTQYSSVIFWHSPEQQ